MIARRYRMETEIRRGAFGVIYKGVFEKANESVAIKIDHSPHATLKHEIRIIQYLYMAGARKIPSIYWFGTHEDKPCVVMTLYECSLYDYRLRTLPTEVQVSKMMWMIIDIMESIHKHLVLHRDIKLQNFMIKNGEIYLIDFGLATFYMNENGEHIPNDISTNMIGSPCFASLRVHEGNRYSRRDDMISLVYIWFYLRGFSWNDIPSPVEDCHKENLSPIHIEYPANKVLRYKKERIVPFLLRYFSERNEDTVVTFIRYIEYVYEMTYEEAPKYGPMKMLFIETDTTTSMTIS